MHTKFRGGNKRVKYQRAFDTSKKRYGEMLSPKETDVVIVREFRFNYVENRLGRYRLVSHKTGYVL